MVDWADEKAANLVPCKYPLRFDSPLVWPCGPGPLCANCRLRPAIAAALRESARLSEPDRERIVREEMAKMETAGWDCANGWSVSGDALLDTPNVTMAKQLHDQECIGNRCSGALRRLIAVPEEAPDGR